MTSPPPHSMSKVTTTHRTHMDDPVEVELKLEYHPSDRDRLVASPLLADGGSSDAQNLIATYFDTLDFRLDQAGYALRIRREGRRRIQTVKAQAGQAAGLFVRGEWERRVTGDTPILDEKAGPLGQMIDPATIDRIAPIFVTHIERVKGLIERPEGTLIEYAVDSGKVQSGARSVDISELELELKRGSSQRLFDLARALNDEVPLRLGVQAKSERGYALARKTLAAAVKAEPVNLDGDAGGDAAFAMIAGACLRQFRLNETLLLRSGAVDAVHQSRVAIRRLRSAFWLFRPLFDGDARAAILAAELRWLAGELGDVRDIDVLLPSCDGAARAALAAMRESRLTHLLVQLESSRARMLPIDIAEWVAIGAWRTNPADPDLCERNICRFASDRLDRLRKRIRREGKGLAELDDEHRHEVRKDAKKLRYATEFFGSLYKGKKARRRRNHFGERLAALQDKLGELNDIAAAPALVQRLGLDIELPTLGRKGRKRLLDDAEDCFEALIDTRPFWRD